MGIDEPLTYLKGVGPEAAKKFAWLGIKSVGQLIDYYPWATPITHIYNLFGT